MARRASAGLGITGPARRLQHHPTFHFVWRCGLFSERGDGVMMRVMMMMMMGMEMGVK